MRLFTEPLRRLALLALLLASVLTPAVVMGHALGEDYIVVSFNENSIEGHFEVHFEDLEDKLGLRIPAGPEAAEQLLLRDGRAWRACEACHTGPA